MSAIDRLRAEAAWIDTPYGPELRCIVGPAEADTSSPVARTGTVTVGSGPPLPGPDQPPARYTRVIVLCTDDEDVAAMWERARVCPDRHWFGCAAGRVRVAHDEVEEVPA